MFSSRPSSFACRPSADSELRDSCCARSAPALAPCSANRQTSTASSTADDSTGSSSQRGSRTFAASRPMNAQPAMTSMGTNRLTFR